MFPSSSHRRSIWTHLSFFCSCRSIDRRAFRKIQRFAPRPVGWNSIINADNDYITSVDESDRVRRNEVELMNPRISVANERGAAWTRALDSGKNFARGKWRRKCIFATLATRELAGRARARSPPLRAISTVKLYTKRTERELTPRNAPAHAHTMLRWFPGDSTFRLKILRRFVTRLKKSKYAIKKKFIRCNFHEIRNLLEKNRSNLQDRALSHDRSTFFH